MANLLQQDSFLRQADALLRATGGRCAVLRVPQPAAGGDDAEQLGLATPLFSDLPLGPVAFRKTASTTSVLVSATAVNAVVGTLSFDSAEVLFATAAGLVVDDVLYTIEGCTALQAQGVAYCYRLELDKQEIGNRK